MSVRNRLRRNVFDRGGTKDGLTIFWLRRNAGIGWNWIRGARTISHKRLCWRRVRRFFQSVFDDYCGNGCFDLNFCAEA